jgi:hypothetical protein
LTLVVQSERFNSMSKQINDGGPAFPGTVWHEDKGVRIGVPVLGISKRDYFAAAAISAIANEYSNVSHAARAAFDIADAMIAEGEKR